MGTKNGFCEGIHTKTKMADSGSGRLDHLNADIGHRQFIYVPKAMIKTGMMEEEEPKG
jgi:hypothetical protein